jgi:hypothetical protein
VAVTTIPASRPGDVEVIGASTTPGKTVLMVMAANEWNSGTTATPLDNTGKFQVIVRYSVAPTPTHMAIDINGYYIALDPSHAGDYFSIIGDVAVTDKGLLDVVQTGSLGAAIRATGGGGADVRLAQKAAANDVASGTVRARGAGLNSNTFAFLHRTVASPSLAPNVCDGTTPGIDAHYTRLSTATQAFDPTADLSGLLVFVQQRGTGTTKAVSTVYRSAAHCASGDALGNGWYLYDSNGTFGANEDYAIMVIYP